MAGYLQTAGNKLLSWIGNSDPSPTGKLWGKVAIVGGAIGVSLIVALIPVSMELSKEITIKNSAKGVYDFFADTPTESLWPRIHPFIIRATVKQQYNNSEDVEITEARDGKELVAPHMCQIVKRSGSKTVEMHSSFSLSLFARLQFRAIMQIVHVSNSECKYINTVNCRVPLFMALPVRSVLREAWIDGRESVPYAVKDAVEDV